jgi:hypothetical protein
MTTSTATYLMYGAGAVLAIALIVIIIMAIRKKVVKK